MRAIISISQSSQGERVTLFGYGPTESVARENAYTYVNHGRNDFSAEFDGGTLIDVSDRLEALFNEKGWDDIYNEHGDFVGRRANNHHHKLINAVSNLFIKDGMLDYQENQIEAVIDKPVLAAIKARISCSDSEIDYSEENY